MWTPRSLSSRLFVAIAGVAMASLLIGAWLFVRAASIQQIRDVRVMRGPDGQDRVIERVTEAEAPPAPPPLDRRLLLIFGVVVVGAAAATIVIAQHTLGPLRTLRAAAETVASGDLSARVPERGAEELASLARAFNLMAGRLEQQDRLKRDLTNDVAHELRTPITNLRCHLEAIVDGVVRVDAETIGALGADVRQLERLVEDLGLLAQADAGQLRLTPEHVALSTVVTEIARDLAPRLAIAGITLDRDVAADAHVYVDRIRLRQILTNLLDNAIAHTPSGGRIVVAARANGAGAVVEVRDTGEGIAPEHLPHLFDRFYRADPSRSRRTGGAGLGLAIAKHLVTASHGTIAVASEPGRGAAFTVTLPGAVPLADEH
ncbi:MAG TPA: ATP-binding protein [Vicinamibacterales bacterium]|nr:ATP-binding protein [Vicinamibacterales bacterium]